MVNRSLNYYFFALLLLFQFHNLQSQRVCGHDHWMEQIKQHPELYQEILDNQRKARKYISEGERITCGAGNTLVIPVAVHFNGSITNANMTCITNTINDQLQVLNEDFGGYNSDIGNYCMHSSNCPTEYPPNALGNDACIQFCLATQNLPGGASSAITFGQYTWDIGATGWNGFMNIFVSDVAPPGTPANLLGIANLSGAANPNGNGFFVIASSFGGYGNSCTSGIPLNDASPFNLGRTGTHEAGHYFGLYHVFEGCSNGDLIADTPDQDTDNSGNPTVNYGTCVSTAINSCSSQDFFFNYMDYVNDASMYMFTNNQATVMKATGDMGSWASSSITCGPMDHTPTYPVGGCPPPSAPTSAFTHDYSGNPLCAALATINFTDQSTGFPTSWSWTFSGAGVSPTSSTSQNPTVMFNSTGTLTATLTATNGAGSGTPSVQNISVFIENPTNCADCGNTYVDDGGSGGNYSANDMTVTYCANTGEVVELDFSTIDIEPWAGNFSSTDHIKVYDASMVGGTPVNYIFQNSIYKLVGSTLTPVGNIYQGTQQCVTLFFDNSGDSYPGWEASINCINAPTCSDGIQNQGETFVDCGGPCTACGSFCDNFAFTDAGGSSNPTGPQTQTWLMCADNNSDRLIVDFSTIDMNPFNNGTLQISDGDNNSGGWDYYVSGNNVYISGGGSSLVQVGSTIVSTNDCFYFVFFNGSGTSNGWIANTNCCEDAVCPSATNAGGPVNATISTVCPGSDITDYVSFRSEEGGSRACSTPSLQYQTYYMIQCDGDGGLLEIDVSSNSNGGNVEAGLYGPVTGSCPNYSGGSYVDCEDGNDPSPLSRMTNANELYIVVVTSDTPGEFTIQSTSGSTALPVDLKLLTARQEFNSIVLNWETENEINNLGFNVQKSKDGKLFSSIGFVDAITEFESNEYRFVDVDVKSGTYYYRLQQIDVDGNTTYSEVVDLKIEINNDEVSVFPNPAKETLFVKSSGDINSVKLYDIYGKNVPIQLLRDEGITEINVKDVPRGVYFVHISTQSGIYNEQVVIVD